MIFRTLRACVNTAPLWTALVASAAFAHPITVDGSAAEWSKRLPQGVDMGMLVRDETGAGELVWRDRVELTALLVPLKPPELTELRVAGDATALQLLARVPHYTGDNRVQLQVAIDLDQIPGSGADSFLGGATKLSTYAAREYLVQTMFQSVGKCRVLNAQNHSLDYVGCAHGADGIEIAIPWSKLGLSGPPSTPVRLTVAVFRGDAQEKVQEAGNGAASDAYDAVTNYGNPGSNPGTSAELSDGVIDYYLDVWFDETGEVRAPILIDRFNLNPAAGSSGTWIKLRNHTKYNLSTSPYKLGDEETPDGNEGMGGLGNGTLAAGAALAIAGSVPDYLKAFGVLPDREMVNGSASVPNLVPYATWSTTNYFPFSTGGDEILLLDGSDTIIDLVVYGSGSYNGLPTLPSQQGQVFFRSPAGTDTDRLIDFQTGASCASTAGCATCESCEQNACVPQSVGTSCSDGNACNGAETCNGKGSCLSGTALLCNDADICTSDSCNPALGCTFTPVAKGAKCDDGNSCTTSDICDGAGECTGALLACAPFSECSDASTSISYANGSCSAGSCDYLTTKVSCAGGCNALTGLCNNDPCAAVACNTPPSPCHKATGVCQKGMCDYEFAPQGTPCSDGDACSPVDVCDGAGACSGRTLSCNSTPPAQCDGDTLITFEAVGSCGAGECSYDKADAVRCPYGCDPNKGACVADPCAGVVCNSPPSRCFDAQGECKEGVCHYGVVQTANCDDGDPCTTGDACDGAGSCLGTPRTCEPYQVCLDAMTSQHFAGGSCSLGTCGYDVRTEDCMFGCDALTGACTGTAVDPCEADPEAHGCPGVGTGDAGMATSPDAGTTPIGEQDAGMVATTEQDAGGMNPVDETVRSQDAGTTAADNMPVIGDEPGSDEAEPAAEPPSASVCATKPGSDSTSWVQLTALAGVLLAGTRRRRGL